MEEYCTIAENQETPSVHTALMLRFASFAYGTLISQLLEGITEASARDNSEYVDPFMRYTESEGMTHLHNK